MGFRQEVAFESSGIFEEHGEQAEPGAQSLGRTGNRGCLWPGEGLAGEKGD